MSSSFKINDEVLATEYGKDYRGVIKFISITPIPYNPYRHNAREEHVTYTVETPEKKLLFNLREEDIIAYDTSILDWLRDR